jgi:hypothetical protein
MYSSFEIFLADRFFYYLLGSTLTADELSNFDTIFSLGSSIHVFLATNPASPGILLARQLAKTIHDKHNN